MRGLFLWVFLASCALAELEVRAYRIGEDELREIYENWTKNEWPTLKIVQKPGFRSRFLKQGAEMLDFTTPMRGFVGEKFSGTAVLLPKEELLVMRAEVEHHEAFAETVGDQRSRMVRISIPVFKAATDQPFPSFYANRPDGVEEVAQVTLLSNPGETARASSKDGFLTCELECQIDSNDDLLELRVDLTFDGGKQESFSVKTGFTLPLGVGFLQEVGSQDRKTSLSFGVETELVTAEGKSFDEWIEKEEEGFFLREARLASFQKAGEIEDLPEVDELDAKAEIGRFLVPPTFIRFIATTSAEDDPFTNEEKEARGEEREEEGLIYRGQHPELEKFGPGSLLDVSQLLRQNGLEFREGDFAVFHEESSQLIAKLPQVQMWLLEGIVGYPDPASPRMVLIEFTLWESEKRKRILKKISSVVLPGQAGEVSLGKKLACQVEAQIDSNDALIEMRLKLGRTKTLETSPMMKTGLALRSGTEMAVLEEVVNGKHRTWMVKARVIRVPEDVAAALSR
jgi:hypothetical protein